MKIIKQVLAVFFVIGIIGLIGCASKPKVTIVELENKGTLWKINTPEWVKTYVADGISRVQSGPEFKDKYVIIGEESGVNRQFVLAWADSFSAQQRIGAMVRTNIDSSLTARVRAAAQSTGGLNSLEGANSGDFRQEIDNMLGVIVNVSYSGALHEGDWWSLLRRYDPDQKGVFSDTYTAYVLYTIPKAEMNRQVAYALATSVNADSRLYDITIQLARDILLHGMDYLGEGGGVASDNAQPSQAKETPSAAKPTGNIAIINNSSDTGSIMSMVKIYTGFQANGVPFLTYNTQVLRGQQASWDLPEGPYTVEVFLNGRQESNRYGGTTTVGVTSGGNFIADFSSGSISSFTKLR